MRATTLVFPMRNNEILLGRKKKGFGKAYVNGFGGKLQGKESFEECAVRELYEESGLVVAASDLVLIGFLDFRYEKRPELNHPSYIYKVEKWTGEALVTEEMEPKWYSLQDIPYENMWEADREWMPLLLDGHYIEGYVLFGEDGKSVKESQYRTVPLVKKRTWTEELLLWFESNRRELPWREERNPYKTWVSEIMLQQTRVEAVRPYFNAWMERFPRLEDVANGTEEDVVKAWQGLGYYSRVRNMQKGMQEVVEKYGGVIPTQRKELESVCGIGSYTAGAILSIAYGLPEPAVDGNVLRIYARLYDIDLDIMKTPARKLITSLVQDTISWAQAGDFNEALMDFGSAICIPKNPRCEECPISWHCLARKGGKEKALPVRTKKQPPKDKTLVLHRIRAGEVYLVHRRGDTGVLRGMWEFPTTELEGVLTRMDGALQEAWRQDERHFLSWLHPVHTPYCLEEEVPYIAGDEKPVIVHTFSHIRWHMYLGRECVLPDEVKKIPLPDGWSWVTKDTYMNLAWAGPHGKLWGMGLLVGAEDEA